MAETVYAMLTPETDQQLLGVSLRPYKAKHSCRCCTAKFAARVATYESYMKQVRYSANLTSLIYFDAGLDGQRFTMTAVMKKHPMACMLNNHKPAASHSSLTTSSKSTLPQQQHLQPPVPTASAPLAHLLPSRLPPESKSIIGSM